jgi:hypothetical protein
MYIHGFRAHTLGKEASECVYACILGNGLLKTLFIAKEDDESMRDIIAVVTYGTMNVCMYVVCIYVCMDI